MMQCCYEAIGRWMECEWPQAFQCSSRKYHTVLATFFSIGLSEKTMHLRRRNAEQKTQNPSKSFSCRVMPTKSPASYPQIRPASLAPQKYAPKYLHATFERHACPSQKFGPHNATSSHRFHRINMVPDMGCSTEPDRRCLFRLPCHWFR